MTLDLGQLTLEPFRQPPEQVLAGDQAEHRVTQKPEPLVARDAAVRHAGVREGGDEHRAVAEPVAEPLLEAGKHGFVHGRSLRHGAGRGT